MNVPAVTICCATYNHEKYIRDALNGFLMQRTNFPFEILVHDDASTDGTADIVREYEAKYPDVIKPTYQTENQYSQGKSIWCEYQFPRAKGKYIALCEGDDFWTDPDKLQIQYDFMENHPSYSMCFHGSTVVEQNGQDGHCYDNIRNRDYTGSELFSSNRWPVPTASIFFRTEYSSKIPVSKDFWCGDVVVCLAMSECGKIHAFEKEMSVYRPLPTGAVATLYLKMDKNWLEREIKFFSAMKKCFHVVSPSLFEKKLTRSFYLHLLYVKRHVSSKEAWKTFLRYPFVKKIQMVYLYLQFRLQRITGRRAICR